MKLNALFYSLKMVVLKNIVINFVVLKILTTKFAKKNNSHALRSTLSVALYFVNFCHGYTNIVFVYSWQNYLFFDA